uniref:3-ketoacyl-CoA thiolase, mitochondrial n=1 Tax=Bursaphelenchus xylophilus TaxID=6326 RepID=A0A1I7S134_BURXY
MSRGRDVFIVSAKRTAFGTFGGKLKGKNATELAELAARAALNAASIDPQHIDHVIFGNVVQSSKCAAYLSRHVLLRVGIPIEKPAVTINRLCGSGFEAITQGAQQIIAGDSEVVLAGGTENMSQHPYVVRQGRFGIPLGANVEFEDVLWSLLTDQYTKIPMGLTAEKLGAKYGVTRQETDAFALASQTRWKHANNAGYFKAEIEPLKLKTRKGEETFEVDEHPRETTAESLAKLPPVFQKDGLVTAGNASGISDGAAAAVVASAEAVQKYKLQPLARLVDWRAVGCDPTIMGIGPVGAVEWILKKHKLTFDNIDLVEVNEAFAPQVLAVQKALNIPSEKLNVNGGAIALGHPLAASGARITAHLCHELHRRNGKYAIGSACIGGGQGIAVLLEKV